MPSTNKTRTTDVDKPIIKENFLIIFLAFTFLLLIVGSCVNIPGIIDSPEFQLKLDPIWAKAILKEKGQINFYIAYFIIEFLWYIMLCLVLFIFINAKHVNSELFSISANQKIILKSVLGILLIGIFITNSIEVYNYLLRFQSLESAHNIKLVLLVVVSFWLLLVLIYEYFESILPTLISFLQSAAYSLIILAIIGFFLPKAPQVNSIVVNLYDSPINFLVLLLVAPIYAIAMAHYPSYFNIDETKFSWYSSERIKLWKFLPVPIVIFYKNVDPVSKKDVVKKQDWQDSNYQTNTPAAPKPEINDANYQKIDKSKKGDKPVISYLNFMLRTLGILFFAALFYMVGYTSQVNFDWPVSISRIGISLLGICIYLLFYLRNRKTEWLDKHYAFLNEKLPDFYDGDYTPQSQQFLNINEENDNPKSEDPTSKKNTKDDSIFSINKWVSIYLFIFSATFLLHFLLFFKLFFIDCAECRYNNFNALLSLVCIAFQMITFVIFRTFRSALKFTLYNVKDKAVLNSFYVLRKILVKNGIDSVSKYEIDEKREKITDFFKTTDFPSKISNLKFFRWLRFGTFSNNITYLQIMAYIGIINFIYLIVINIFTKAALFSNAILIILSYLFFYYGVILVLTKAFIYFNYSNEEFAFKKRKKFNFSLTIIALVFIALNVSKEIWRNELFTLKLIDKDNSKEVSITDYVQNLPKDQTRYYIGSYGGGLKANAWTMTVLNQLYENDTNFFKKVVCISGVSGGTMGLINMAGIVNSEKNPLDWQPIITKISTSNILAIDLSHILGRDTFSHLFVPGFNLQGYDRSSVAMNQYARFTNNIDEINNPSAYRVFWKKLYEKEEKAFPILISNSTNVIGNQGMAVSISTKEGSPENSFLYQGANNILDIYTNKYKKNPFIVEEKTLSYYDAASTSNRFPLLSPATKIETIGHFNDGGIYENSGMLSAFKLFRAINCVEGIDELENLKQRNVFINIVNDKNAYIKYKVSENLKNGISINKINENSEINAIIGSISSTEMMPIFIKTELDRLTDYENIEFYTVYLPHRFTPADVKMIYGSDIEFGEGFNLTYETLYNKATINNLSIEQLVTNNCKNDDVPIIEPPMSRVMAVAAYDFMLQMRNHPSVKFALQSIMDKNDDSSF